MENKKSSRKSFAIYIVVVLVVALVLGQLIATSVINMKTSACGLLQAGLQQVGNQQDSTPQTASKCTAVVMAAEPLIRIVAGFFSIIFTAILGVFGIVIPDMIQFNRDFQDADKGFPKF